MPAYGENKLQLSDPQVERTRNAVLNAARELLFTEGPGAVTHQRVAKASKVGRATLYRHWPERNDLLLAVLNSLAPPPLADVKVGPAIDQLREAMRAVRAALWGELGTIFATLIERAEWDTRLKPVKHKVIQWANESLVATVKLGTERGELAPRVQPELVVSALLGAMLARRFVLDEPMSDEDLDRILDALVPQRL
jgi:AcrR family transcriptional regulator